MYMENDAIFMSTLTLNCVLNWIYVTSNQTFASNKTFISWMLINSDKRSAVGCSWNPGTSMLIQEGAVSTWH